MGIQDQILREIRRYPPLPPTPGILPEQSNQNFKHSSRHNPCPICQKDHGCKISNNLILCLRGDSSWSVSGWKFIKPLRGGMGGMFKADSGNHREYRPEPKSAKPSNIIPLTDKQLNREARKILKQLGLSTKHRQALLNRGLTDSQIDAVGFVSVEKYQEFNLVPINRNFPGMGTRGTLGNADSGYLIPVRNINKEITGFQIANDDRSNGKKYPWLTGCSERRVSKERPLQFLKLNNSTDLDIIEGTLKPLIAANLHNINVLGSGGTAWHGSPNELAAIINLGLFTRYILNLDAGCKLNHHVMRAYRELFLFLKKHGIKLLVRDWGQGEQPKSEGSDIDEIDSETFKHARIISFKEWDNPDELKTFLAQYETRKNKAVISGDDWFQQFKIPELSQIIKRFYSRRIKKNTVKTEEKQPANTPKKTPEQVTESSAIVLWKPQPLISMPYVPGQLPTVEEWAEMGCPKIIIQQGQRLAFYGEAFDKGFKYLLDSTPTGHFKSYDAGLIDLSTFGIDPSDSDNKSRIFNLSPDHRNATTSTVEQYFVDLEARHNGLNYDHSRKTALGNPHVVRAVGNQTPDIPSNCPETNTFLTVSELGLTAFGGKDSPICQSCPLLMNGCSFLENRRDTLKNERLIRADINSMPTPSSDDILILDDINIETTHQITIKNDELLKTVGKLQLLSDVRIFKVVRPILATVYKELQPKINEKNKYGISHNEVMELLPTTEELNQLIWEVYADDWLKADDVWGTPIWHYEMINGQPEAVKIIGYDWVAPSLNDLKNESCKISENYAKFINGLQSPEEKQQAIKDNVIPSLLPALIDAFTGNKRINLAIANGGLNITKPAKRHRNIVKSAGFSIALDATKSKADYALSLGVNPNEILEVSEIKRDTKNSHIYIVKGIGRGGVQRRDTMQQRIRIGIEAIAKRHQGQGQNVGLIDHKSAMDSYQDLAKSLKLGYWHKDTRGSNQFLSTQTLISVGSPVPNLGQMAAEYQTLTGWIVNNPEQLTGRYGAWVKRKIQAELIQCVGRLRAHLRPNEQLHIYLLADLDDDTISAVRLAYPTATVTVEDVYDYAPEAASKGKQTERGIVNALWSSIKSGTAATIDQIAEKVNITKSGVTKCLKDRLNIGFRALKKSLLLLLEAINSKSKLSDLDEDTKWIAENYLNDAIKDLEMGDISPADVVVRVIEIPRCYGLVVGKQILAATPTTTLCKLLGVVLRFLPNQIKQELSGLIPILIS